MALSAGPGPEWGVQLEVNGNAPLFRALAVERHVDVAAHRPQVRRLWCACSLVKVGSDRGRQARDLGVTQTFRNLLARRDDPLDGKVRAGMSCVGWRSRVWDLSPCC